MMKEEFFEEIFKKLPDTNAINEIDPVMFQYILDSEALGFDYETILKIWEIAFEKKFHLDVWFSYILVETFRYLQTRGFSQTGAYNAVINMKENLKNMR